MSRRTSAVAIASLSLVSLLAACAPDDDLAAPDLPVDDAVTVDTSSPAARAQYDANVAFALARPDIAPDFRAELKKIVGTI